MFNRLLTGFIFALLIGSFGSLQASVEIDLTEDTKARPVMLMMYEAKLGGFKTSLTDAGGAFSKYTKNVASKNSLVMTLQAREAVEFTSGNTTYKAAKDGEVLFGVFLGVSGTLGTQTGNIPLHKDFYWSGQKDKTGAESVTTVLLILRQWAGKLGIDGAGGLDQATLCSSIEEKLQEN